jgi:hypothetical protein
MGLPADSRYGVGIVLLAAAATMWKIFFPVFSNLPHVLRLFGIGEMCVDRI